MNNLRHTMGNSPRRDLDNEIWNTMKNLIKALQSSTVDTLISKLYKWCSAINIVKEFSSNEIGNYPYIK